MDDFIKQKELIYDHLVVASSEWGYSLDLESQTKRHQKDDGGDAGHHHYDQQPAVQVAFLKDVRALVTVFEEMGNPFLERSQDLLVIDTMDIMDAQVAETVRRIETLGEEQYTEYVTERLEECTTPITQTIPKSKLPLFSRPPVKSKSRHKEQLAALKSDCGLFSRLYISCQTRDGDMDNFFSHENQAARMMQTHFLHTLEMFLMY